MRKKLRLRTLRGLLYGDGLRLVTTPSGERTPARERDEHVVVLSSRSGERMRTTPPSLIFHEGVCGLLGGLVLGWLTGCCWATSWTTDGFVAGLY
jgi:hypothetical protein